MRTLLLISTLLFLAACGGQQATFSEDSTQFKSLLDGETVEVIPNNELDIDLVDEDTGLIDDNNMEEEPAYEDEDNDEEIFTILKLFFLLCTKIITKLTCEC